MTDYGKEIFSENQTWSGYQGTIQENQIRRQNRVCMYEQRTVTEKAYRGSQSSSGLLDNFKNTLNTTSCLSDQSEG